MNSVTGATLIHNWAGTEIAKKPLKIIGGIGLLGLAVAGAIFLYLRSQSFQCIQPQLRKVSDWKKIDQSDRKVEQENKDDIETLQEQINQLSAQHLKLRNQEITKRENLILLNDEDLDNRYNQDMYTDIRGGGYKELAKFPRYEVPKPAHSPGCTDDKDKLNYEKKTQVEF